MSIAKQATPPQADRAERKKGSPIGWVLGGLQGFLTQTALVFLNTNYDRIIADAQDVPEVGLLLFGLIGFLLVSIAVFAFGVLRRLLSVRARTKGWGPVFGFLMGMAVASLAMRVA